jgi:hypothetical protein
MRPCRTRAPPGFPQHLPHSKMPLEGHAFLGSCNFRVNLALTRSLGPAFSRNLTPRLPHARGIWIPRIQSMAGHLKRYYPWGLKASLQGSCAARWMIPDTVEEVDHPFDSELRVVTGHRSSFACNGGNKGATEPRTELFCR